MPRLIPSQRARPGAVIAALLALGALSAAAVPATARAQPPPTDLIYNDGVDRWSLLPRKLQNRQLFEQLDSELQNGRLGPSGGPVAMAADLSVGGEIELPSSQLTRFHGFFVLDAFAAARPFEGIDVNLNLTLFNPSASDGYRVSSGILPGISVHLHRELLDLLEAPLRVDLLAFDLDQVTFAQGLLVEELPLEGYSGQVTWRDLFFRTTFAGQVFVDQDDLWMASLGAFGGMVELDYAYWRSEPPPALDDFFDDEGRFIEPDLPHRNAHYLGASGEWRPAADVPLRVAGEVQLRLREHPKIAALVRADWLERALWRLSVHAGAQLRFYQQGFGPAGDLAELYTVPNLPSREDTYVTNSIEFFPISRYYDQWSATVMAEARLAVVDWLTIAADGEYLLRVVSDPRQNRRVVYLDGIDRVPGILHDFAYRAGIEVTPFAGLPHRLSAKVTNKLVAAGLTPVDKDSRRFIRDALLLFEVEVFL